ncbi:hypothetical protein ACI2K4_05920 [Micromonospora sp. NPDC050397]|uniref:hypothetical protein n=1 Tax=Micromonospora sp. NPDC050397 TaxID=3364279 RepID=UPI00384F0B0F
MTDHWDGWADDGSGFDDGSDPDAPADDGYPVDGFGADDDTGGVGAGEQDPGGSGAGSWPIGYGDAPFTDDGEVGFGYADASPTDGDAHTGFGGAGDGVSGFGPADDATGTPDAQVGFGPAGPPVGADPDLGLYGDAESWPPPAFPEAIEGGVVPEPVDGFPWADPTTLGDPDTPSAQPALGYADAPDPTELAGYDARELPPGVDPWAALADSDDPATSALARFWGPRGT